MSFDITEDVRTTATPRPTKVTGETPTAPKETVTDLENDQAVVDTETETKE